MESADSMASMDKASRNKVSAVGEENVLNRWKNIDEVYQSGSFRCIMSLSYRVTFLCIFCWQTNYTPKCPVRYFFLKSCKVV